MTFSKYFVVVAILGFSFQGQAYSGCDQLSLFGSSLVSNITALASAVGQIAAPANCETLKTATCSATFYGKGDNFTSGTTACENRFRPLQDKTVAIKTVGSGGFFSKSFCGKRAIISTYDPKTKTTKQVEVKVSDSGSMGGRTSRRCIDLSYRAAFELGIISRGVASNTKIKICK